MLIGGFWHGANWTFIVWGGLHGGALVVHKFFMERTKHISIRNNFVSQFLSVISSLATFLFVVLAWLFFRAPDFHSAWFYLDRIFVHTVSSNLTADLFIIMLFYFIAILVIDVVELKTKRHDFLAILSPAARFGIAIPVWIAVIFFMYTIGKPMPFIYFQF